MSTDWHIHCVDCNVTHRFDDANRRDRLMLTLIKHADSIASLVELLEEAGGDVELKTFWGRIDAAWFRAHLGHNLMPIDEYGHLLDQCAKRIECTCGALHWCSLKKDHEGPCLLPGSSA